MRKSQSVKERPGTICSFDLALNCGFKSSDDSAIHSRSRELYVVEKNKHELLSLILLSLNC